MHIDEAFPSKYLKAADLQGKTIRLTIDSYGMEEIGKDEKVILYFRGKKKGLVLNVTNARMIGERYGGDMDNWIGKEIELYPTKVPFEGKLTDAIRVQSPIPPAAIQGSPEEPPF